MTLLQPVLKYPGSKWGIAPWIIGHFPAHEAYVEPFFGSGAVLIRKEPSRSELVGDIDGDVCAFFRVLRDQPEELARVLSLTPYARQEVLDARVPADVDDLERARRLAVTTWQTRGGSQDRRMPAWRFDLYGAARRSLAHTWGTLPDRVLVLAERLRHVAIENKPALEILDLVAKRGVHALIYADPPYVMGSIDPRLYRHAMTEQDHCDLLDALDRHPGPVILSGYHSPLYDDRLGHWSHVTRTTKNQVNDDRVEVLWLNHVATAQTPLPLMFADHH